MFLNFVYPAGIICFLILKKTLSSIFLHELKQVLTNFISLFHIIGTINITWSTETHSQLNSLVQLTTCTWTNLITTVFQINKNLLIYMCYCKSCNLIGYNTHYLFINRYRVATINVTRQKEFSKSSSQFLWSNSQLTLHPR